MNVTFLDEPALEFGGSGRHIDIRFGIMGHGPLDRTRGTAPKRIRVGLVGSAETVEGTLRWLNACRSGIAAKPSRQPNLFPCFPGFTEDLEFLSELVTEEQLQRTLPRRVVRDLSLIPSHGQFGVEAVQAVLEEARVLTEDKKPDVIVCAIPPEFVGRIDDGEDLPAEDGDSAPQTGPSLVFHDLLKAKAMGLRKPIQVIRPTTYGGKVPRSKKRRRKGRGLQALWLRYQQVDKTPAALAAEILALTKMNWNSSQFDNMDPITLRAAKQVGDILKHVPLGGHVEPRYSYYM